jgi:invasion protein IalB
MAQAAEDPESPPVPKPSPAQKPAASAKAGTQKFGNWVLLCQDAAQMTRKTCFVAQQIAEELSKQVVFAWRLQYDDQGNLASIFRTPTGVFVNRGIVLKLGDATEGLKVGYQLCDERKCQAVANVPAEILKSLSAAKTVSAALALTSGKTANVNINMAGFPAAMAALAKLK